MENNDWLQIENGILVHCSMNVTGEMVIPDTVTSIGICAFEGCSGLTSINIPNSVTSIGDGAFEGCTGLTSINIPNSVTSIGEGAFFGCTGLTSINIPSGVTSIGDFAFYYCTGLTSINISNSVTSIGYDTFYGCTSLYHRPVDGEKIIVYKGFDCKEGKLMCRDKVYSLTELNTESKAKICECGIHACMLPIEVLNYHNGDYVYKVEMSGKFNHSHDDSKICATEMRILEKIDKDDLVKETIKILNNLKYEKSFNYNFAIPICHGNNGNAVQCTDRQSNFNDDNFNIH